MNRGKIGPAILGFQLGLLSLIRLKESTVLIHSIDSMQSKAFSEELLSKGKGIKHFLSNVLVH